MAGVGRLPPPLPPEPEPEARLLAPPVPPGRGAGRSLRPVENGLLATRGALAPGRGPGLGWPPRGRGIAPGFGADLP